MTLFQISGPSSTAIFQQLGIQREAATTVGTFVVSRAGKAYDAPGEFRALSRADCLSRVPRIALVLLFLFSNYLQRAYHALLLPLLGFLFLPLTTLAYAWMMNTRQPIAGINLVILIVAVVIDLGGLSRGEYHRRTRWQE
jgi:hypothetical protein